MCGFSGFSLIYTRGPLQDWADKLLEPSRVKAEGFFDANKVNTMWEEHKSGKRNWQYRLWNVLMFQLWYERHHK